MGVLATLLAGCMMGNFLLPMKFARGWRWEQLWLVFSVVSLVILPWCLALSAVPDLAEVYGSATWISLSLPVLFGALWGVAQVLFGICAVRIGMALAYAIVIGLGAVLGSLLPHLASASGLGGAGALLKGLFAMLVGIALCAWAGRRRERAATMKSAVGAMAYRRAVGLAVCAGVLSCCLNLAFAFSQDIIRAAVSRGAGPMSAPFAVWALTLLGGAAINIGYSLRLLAANRSWGGFRPVTDAPLAVLMGILWMGAISLYGAGATLLGADGPATGWALFQISMVLAAGAAGFLSGEWRGAPAGAVRGMIAGLVLLVLAMLLIAAAGMLRARPDRQEHGSARAPLFSHARTKLHEEETG